MTDSIPKQVDYDEVAALIDQLETDLSKLKQGSADVATLRAEVEQLRIALGSDEPAAVKQGLEGLQERLQPEIYDDVVATNYYVTWLGRILGL
ncbi:MAG: hypothetical protein RR240_00595 [Burkholderiaceae bacterium]